MFPPEVGQALESLERVFLLLAFLLGEYFSELT